MARDDGYTRYTVRIPTPLYERVKEAAGEKSVNAEIIERLEDSFRSEADIVMPHVDYAISHTIKRMFEELDKLGVLPSAEESKLSDLEKVFKDKGEKG